MEIKRICLRKRLLTCISVLILTIISSASFAIGGEQVVSLLPNDVVVLPGESTSIQLDYSVSGGEKLTTGLGLRIHYSSRAIDSLTLKEVHGEGLIAIDQTAKDDLDDFDNNPLTDKYIGVAWVGVRGDWPMLLDQPAKLGRIVIKVSPDVDVPRTPITITSSGCAAGYDFEGGSAEIIVP